MKILAIVVEVEVVGARETNDYSKKKKNNFNQYLHVFFCIKGSSKNYICMSTYYNNNNNIICKY